MMAGRVCDLPYFDILLELLEQDYPALRLAFGRHVHWGYWDRPAQGCPGAEDFAEAAERLSRRVYEAAGVCHGQRVLDVGCGFGGTVASLNETRHGMELVGLNIDPRQLSRAAREVAALPVNRIQWVQADACRLPFTDASLDAVLAVECIFHFPDRERFFREAWRVLKPGGRLALSDFIVTPLVRPVTWLVARWPMRSGFYGRCDVGYGWDDYRGLADRSGFHITRQEDITRNTLPTYRFLRNLHRTVPFGSFSAIVETLLAEWSSRLGCLRYGVLAFEKGQTSG